MYRYIVEQADIDILRQSNRIIYGKVELLNHNMQIVNTIEGNVFNDNFSCDGESAVRRTYTCDLIVDNDMFQIGRDKNIWIDRYIRVYYGIMTQRSQVKRWYLLGTFTFVNMSSSYSTTTKTISITCMDRMSELDGTKGGVMVYNTQADVTFKVLAGQSFNEVLIGLLDAADIVDYEVSGVDDYIIPYDIEWTKGATFYEAFNTLKELYNYWEFFFDEQGAFIWRKTPTGYGEDIIMDDGVLSPLVISEQVEDNFSNVYNATEVWGRQLDLVEDDRFAGTCTGGTSVSDNVWSIALENITAMSDLDNFTSIGIRISGAFGKYICINNLENIPILTSDGSTLADNTYVPNQIYVFRYRRTATGDLNGTPYLNFYLMGQFQAHGYYEETNPNVPYSVPNVGYVIPKVIENDALYSDDLCYNQAQYETYQTTAKQDSLSLQMIIVPFLEPSQKFRYTLLSTGETAEWIIKKYSWSSLSGVMNVELYRFLEDYSFVVDRAS